MTSHSARLPDNNQTGFGGRWIERSKPISFRLNGHVFQGYSGDTVYTALLASGVTTLGEHLGSPIGLTTRGLPAILAVGETDLTLSLPMSRAPITAAANYITLPATKTNGLKRFFRGEHNLGLSLDAAHSLTQPWRHATPSERLSTDLIVVGGGVAGLSAALAATRRGLSVILIDERQSLGGTSGLFGAQDGEDNAEDAMVRLSNAVQENAEITVFTSTEVIGIRQGLVRAHVIELNHGRVTGKVLDIAAEKIVLATGALERLPLFSGNRLPGVIGALEAYELATRYGLWQGRSAVLFTSTNPGYHLAVKAREAGITINRLLDTRPTPASRYIEFSRAYGLVQTPESQIEQVRLEGNGLTVQFRGVSQQSVSTQRLIANAGWQANLALWHMAGGTSQWDAQVSRLEASGQLEGIVLAGSATGYKTRNGCIQSGADAVDQLLAKPRKPISELVVDPIYETPDEAIAFPVRQGPAPIYLDAGASLVSIPKSKKRASDQVPALSEIGRALSLNDISAAVCLNWLPSSAAGIVASERTPHGPLPAEEIAANSNSNDGPKFRVPVYLSGRYGQDARVVKLFIAEQRTVSSGSLIFRNSDCRDAKKAIGVVLRHEDSGPTALLAAQAFRAALPVSIQDSGSIIAAKIDTPLD